MGISGAGFRAARAAVFTAVCVMLSVGTHVLLSATPVPLLPLLAVTGAVFLVAFALAGRERGYWHIAALLVPLELAADTVFTTGQQTCYGPTGGPVTGPLRTVGFDLVCAGGSFGTPLARIAGDVPATPLAHPATPWLLLTAHVGLGLVAAAWLRRGELALARLLHAAAAEAADWFRTVLVAFGTLRPAPHLRLAAARQVHRAPTAHGLPLLTHSVVRRGPPLTALTTAA